MILWCDGGYDPDENMCRDAALLARADAYAGGAHPGDDGVVLRLFRFVPFGITLGYAQDPARELDLGRCARDGVPWAARPTGGRGIFHAEEWTCSLAAPLEDRRWGGKLVEAYTKLARLLVGSLERLGVPAGVSAAVRRASPRPRSVGGGAATPCFASSARHEVMRAGRKLAGIAQRRTGHALLQQASVLLGEGHLRLVDYLRVPDEQRPRLLEELRAASAHAGDVLGPEPALSVWADVLASLLPAGTHRVDGSAGGFLLTARNTGSYTRPIA